jgi:hypothetical protein
MNIHNTEVYKDGKEIWKICVLEIGVPSALVITFVLNRMGATEVVVSRFPGRRRQATRLGQIVSLLELACFRYLDLPA